MIALSSLMLLVCLAGISVVVHAPAGDDAFLIQLWLLIGIAVAIKSIKSSVKARQTNRSKQQSNE
jgi:hypothetical protein